MNSRCLNCTAAVLFAFAAVAALASPATAADLKRAVPANVHMAVYAKQNDEREYQRKYLQEAWETAEDERIGERILAIVSSRVPKEKLDQAESAWEDAKEALEPISGEALLDAEECVFAQRMEGPVSHTLVAVRLSSEDAASFDRGLTQLFELFDQWGEDKVTVETSESGDAKITTLRLPEHSPYHPSIARLDDVVIFSTSPKLLEESAEQLQSASGESKFDDPRLKEALENLPEPEDTIAFFDGRQLWKSLGGIGDFIREKAPDDEKAQRAAKVLDRLVEEIAILDYEVTVEYTEEGQNRVAAMGKLAEDYEEKALGQALTQGEPFTDWQKWVPKDATAYCMGTGVNLHIVYEGVMEFVREEFPEAQEGLEKFEEMQEKIEVNIDKDILQSFSGEFVSMKLPVEADGKKSEQGVTALKCKNPDKIRELLARAFEGLQDLPALEAQNLELEDSEELDGFQEIRANFFNAVGVKPVIGFQDGWMIISSHEDAAKKLVEVRTGEADSIDGEESLEEFDLEVDGEVYAVSYSDVGAGIRQAADAIDWAGTMAPMFIGMAAAQAKPEEIKTLQEAIGLLPSIAKIVRKFDFFKERLSVVHEGPTEDTYIREAVTLIREPGEGEEDEEESDE